MHGAGNRTRLIWDGMGWDGQAVLIIPLGDPFFPFRFISDICAFCRFDVQGSRWCEADRRIELKSVLYTMRNCWSVWI